MLYISSVNGSVVFLLANTATLGVFTNTIFCSEDAAVMHRMHGRRVQDGSKLMADKHLNLSGTAYQHDQQGNYICTCTVPPLYSMPPVLRMVFQ